MKAGQPLSFYNKDTKATPNEVWHTITACAAPCNKATGVAYPIADAKVQFDSGELGVKGPPTAGRVDWTGAEESARRHVHLLLPDPSADARRVPGHQLKVAFVVEPEVRRRAE